MGLEFEWCVWESTCGGSAVFAATLEHERAAIAATRFMFSVEVGSDMEFECRATSLYSVQHRKQDVDDQHVGDCPAQGERDPQRI